MGNPFLLSSKYFISFLWSLETNGYLIAAIIPKVIKIKGTKEIMNLNENKKKKVVVQIQPPSTGLTKPARPIEKVTPATANPDATFLIKVIKPLKVPSSLLPTTSSATSVTSPNIA